MEMNGHSRRSLRMSRSLRGHGPTGVSWWPSERLSKLEHWRSWMRRKESQRTWCGPPNWIL
ncbi:unnamed protein product [Echinostoma caproni]|uniref:Alternative protein n=1 Tax=Echinostoma caproni TaxID=27848 RepID=A0A183B8B2_9TREM|nr:unnamed protein product [Echinostoma caproni]